jgi:leader peptidase (prepilin peptidase)/N-methyltransferase
MSLNATIVVVSWAGLGAAVGAVLGQTMWSDNATRTQGSGARSPPSRTCLAIGRTIATALLFGALAWRFGLRIELLAYSVLAALSVPLSLIDWYEMRLPRRLVLPLYPTLLVLFGAAAIVHHGVEDFVRAVAGMVVLFTAYLVTAMLTRGGVGAGDVQAAGPIGLALAWPSWSTLVAGTLISLCCFTAMAVSLRILSPSIAGREFPFGPAMFAGTFIAVLPPS